jgi:hypothetical protein
MIKNKKMVALVGIIVVLLLGLASVSYAAVNWSADRTERLEQMKARLDEAVAGGVLTQEEADERYAVMETRTGLCDGTGENQGQGGLRIGGMGRTRNGDGTATGEFLRQRGRQRAGGGICQVPADGE